MLIWIFVHVSFMSSEMQILSSGDRTRHFLMQKIWTSLHIVLYFLSSKHHT